MKKYNTPELAEGQGVCDPRKISRRNTFEGSIIQEENHASKQRYDPFGESG